MSDNIEVVDAHCVKPLSKNMEDLSLSDVGPPQQKESLEDEPTHAADEKGNDDAELGEECQENVGDFDKQEITTAMI